MFVLTSRWFGFRLDMMSWLFVVVAVVASMAARDKLDAGQIGLILLYISQLTSLFQWTVRQSAEVENQMTSIERVVEYSHITPEAQPAQPKDPEGWPQAGKVEFRNLSLRYSEDGADVLHNLNCTIAPGEKIGIVGGFLLYLFLFFDIGKRFGGRKEGARGSEGALVRSRV